jgi:hypothetical protein
MGDEFMSSNTNMNGKWYESLVGSTIVRKKYLHEGEVNAVDLADRVASIFSDKDLGSKVRQAMLDADFFPAGRSLFGAGTKGS